MLRDKLTWSHAKNVGQPYHLLFIIRKMGHRYNKGPFNTYTPVIVNLPPGVYSNMYVKDAKGCESNRIGPATIMGIGSGTVSDEVCSRTDCIVTDLPEGSRTRIFIINRLPGILWH